MREICFDDAPRLWHCLERNGGGACHVDRARRHRRIVGRGRLRRARQECAPQYPGSCTGRVDGATGHAARALAPVPCYDARNSWPEREMKVVIEYCGM